MEKPEKYIISKEVEVNKEEYIAHLKKFIAYGEIALKEEDKKVEKYKIRALKNQRDISVRMAKRIEELNKATLTSPDPKFVHLLIDIATKDWVLKEAKKDYPETQATLLYIYRDYYDILRENWGAETFLHMVTAVGKLRVVKTEQKIVEIE